MASKPKYTGLGMVLGAALGVVAGVVAGHIGVWLAIGLAVGIVIGASSRRKTAECPECAELHRAHEARR